MNGILLILLTTFLHLLPLGSKAATLNDNEVMRICKYQLTMEGLSNKIIDCKLIAAIARTETMYKTSMFHPEKTGSYGLLQIQCSTAQMMGWKRKCNQLFDPYDNVRYGIKYIRYLKKNKGTNVTNIKSLIAAYNAGTAIVCRNFNPGKCYPGEYVNHSYVSKVYRHYKYLKQGARNELVASIIQ